MLQHFCEMKSVFMTKRELKIFLSVWNKYNKLYQKYCNKNRVPFPEPLQKEIVKKFYDKSLIISNNSSYDFQGNIELKSSTSFGGGCTPFQSTQSACSRIIYIEIGVHFDVYEISSVDVQKINALVAKGFLNITLSNYKKNARHTIIV